MVGGGVDPGVVFCGVVGCVGDCGGGFVLPGAGVVFGVPLPGVDGCVGVVCGVGLVGVVSGVGLVGVVSGVGALGLVCGVVLSGVGAAVPGAGAAVPGAGAAVPGAGAAVPGVGFVLGCDVLGVWAGAVAAVPAPPDGDAGGAAVCAFIETVKIRKHAESSATPNQFVFVVFGFISNAPNSNFVLLKMYGLRRKAGIRWTTYADNIDRVQTIFTERKKLLLARWIM